MTRARHCGLIIGIGLFASLASVSAEPQAQQAMAVWDTGAPAAEPLDPAALAGKTGWTRVAPDAPAAPFKGDAVISNGRISAVLRKQGTAVEMYSGGEAAVQRARLLLMTADGEAVARLDGVTVVENGRGGACLEASYRTAKGAAAAARFRLKKGEVAVEAEPGAGAAGLRVECPGRFALLPDFFADDIAIDAAKIPLPSIEVPSENFVLHFAGSDEAIVMAVFENRDQDVRMTLAGQGGKRVVTGSEIRFGKGRKIWVGLLESPRIWHVAAKAGDTGKVSRADWKIPFRAQWRADFHRKDDLIDSWTMLLQEKAGGDYVKPSLTGDVHSGYGLERVSPEAVKKGYHPAWADPGGDVFLMPPDWPAALVGPVIFYPLNRTAETPPEVFTVVDFARSCLGAGPCDYILDLEGHKDQYKGRATCGVRDILGRIYSKGQQKEKRAEVEKCLKDGFTFVTHIRSRVAAYLDFVAKIREYLAEQGKARPEIRPSLAELEKILKEIDDRVAQRSPKIKTPDDVARMNDEFRKELLDYEGSDALDRVKRYTKALVEIGGNQDELVAECRRGVKILRQRAGLMMALEPKMAAVAGEVRTRTQEVLRTPAWHEGANK